MNGRPVAVVGCGVSIPGIAGSDDFYRSALAARPHQAGADEPALPWRGMRYKDRATKLALAAAKAALEDARLPITAAEQHDGDTFGVTVSSNLGNVDTVCRVVGIIRASGVNATSAMDLPNASSNVIASSIAICAGLRGLNLMLCNGATSGTDALYTAATAVRAGRAVRMLVVGVEPRTPESERLLRDSNGVSSGQAAFGEGAAALVLERGDAALERGVEPLAFIGRYSFSPTGVPPEALSRLESARGLWLPPNAYTGSVGREHSTKLDLSSTFGDLYGATGVMQALAAVMWLARNGGSTAVATTAQPRGSAAASIEIHRAFPSGANAC